jgi:hypothetical protein
MQRDHPQLFSQAIPLKLATPARGSGLELVPGVTVIQLGSREDSQQPMAWTGFRPAWEAARPSLDVRYGLTPGIGLSATLNPDFSQVENDETPIDLNARFAFFFPEKRPFFLEGAGYLADIGDNTLYTRSIVEPIYGVKTTGQAGPWALGLLHALDRSPGASVNENGAPGFGEDDVANALAATTVLRVGHTVGEGGALAVLAADKQLFGKGERTATNQVVGFDGSIPLGARWTLIGGAQVARTDSATETLVGTSEGLGVERASGEGTGFSAWAVDVGPDVRRETSYLTRSGITMGGASVDRTIELNRRVESLAPGLEFEFDAERNGDSAWWAGATLNATAGVHSFWVDGGPTYESESDVAVNGWSAAAGYEGEAGGALSWHAASVLSRQLDYDLLVPSNGFTVGGSLTLRPTPGIALSPGFEHRGFWPDGAAAESADRLRGKATWQFTRELGVRAIGEYTTGTSFDPTLVSSFLLTWLVHPGTGVWLGYAETTDTALRSAVDRTVFAKATFLVRP